jgi:hypothetical protein
MVKLIKLCLFFLAIYFVTPVNAQINVRFDYDCLLANSKELGQAILETVGENATRKLVEQDINIKIAVEVDSLGRVSRIFRSNLSSLTKKERIQLLSDILSKRMFSICFADGQDNKEVIIKDLRVDFQLNQRHLLALFFPGAFHETYLYYKGRATKVDYIIEKLKEK